MIDSDVLLQEDLVLEDYPIKGDKITSGVFDLELIIIDAESGRPIPGALIGIDSINLTGTCSEGGRVMFTLIPGGSYSIDVIKHGYAASLVLTELYEGCCTSQVVRMIRNA